MEFEQLLRCAPDVARDLEGLGLVDEKLAVFGTLVADQVQRSNRVDVIALAHGVGISEELARAAASVIEPRVGELRPQKRRFLKRIRLR